MSLALVNIPIDQFDQIHDHITTHPLGYQNMHLREACTRGGERDLRYLHAMFVANPRVATIEGMISGPGDLFWHYRLRAPNRRPQINVIAEECSDWHRGRILRMFLREVLERVAEEREFAQHRPKRTPGQFYLLRARPGMPDTHASCRTAVANGVLDQRFVSQIGEWNLRLLHPG